MYLSILLEISNWNFHPSRIHPSDKHWFRKGTFLGQRFLNPTCKIFSEFTCSEPAHPQPWPSAPVAGVKLSGQHPNSVVEQSSQPSKLEPWALVSPSGQHPNSEVWHGQPSWSAPGDMVTWSGQHPNGEWLHPHPRIQVKMTNRGCTKKSSQAKNVQNP